MKTHHYKEWQRMAEEANKNLDSPNPSIKDEVIAIADKEYEDMYHLLHFIAHDYVELSHEKIRIQRDDYIKLARKLLKEVDAGELDS